MFLKKEDERKIVINKIPEYFGSPKVYEAVMQILKRNFREKEVEDIINELNKTENITPENYIKKLAFVLRKYAPSNKITNLLMDLKDKLSSFIYYKIEPKVISMSKDGSQVLRIDISNELGGYFKYKVGIEQMDRKYTSLLYDPVRNFTYTKMIKSYIICPDGVHSFKFIIKPDVFGLQDVNDLNKNKQITINLGIQIKVDGVDGLKSNVEKVPVIINKIL